MQFHFVLFDALQELMMLSFSPLRPDEVAPRRELLTRQLLIIERVRDDVCSAVKREIFIVAALLTVELLLSLITAVPPGAA